MKSEDEKILDLTNDKIIESSDGFSILQQNDETLITYIIEGLFRDDDKEKYVKLKKFKSEPPLLTILDSNENKVSFSLTKEFVKNLKNDLEHVEKAYNGFIYNNNKNLTFKERITNIPKDFKKNPTIYLLLFFATLSIIIMSYLSRR